VDGLGDEVGRAADGDEVDGVELADGGDGFAATLGLADYAEQAGLGEDLAGDLSTRGGGGAAGGTVLPVGSGGQARIPQSASMCECNGVYQYLSFQKPYR